MSQWIDMTVVPRIAKVIRTQVKEPPTRFNIKDPIPGDSMDRINVILAVEKEFGVELTDDVYTVEDLVKAVSFIAEGVEGAT
ncbi:acyl carrier-like protein [Caulobacter phage Seuss]|uniref:Acyl carrier-like protein n=1 Tax=Caulobacter phage Seuss TaxID=1675601 RepID=A0A0K1LNA5_9CAUD|nr:acyl carrier-like protein [Caulobacter phage Seuss]AKU43620.1 acyl carrier-like protein [Caulobacter phage Seuss]